MQVLYNIMMPSIESLDSSSILSSSTIHFYNQEWHMVNVHTIIGRTSHACTVYAYLPKSMEDEDTVTESAAIVSR